MTESTAWTGKTEDGVWINVLVQPRAAKNQVVGLQGDRLKVKLTAPPVEGAANKMCRDFFAQALQVKKAQVEMVSGHKSRTKKLLVRSATPAQVRALLDPSTS